MPGHFGGSHSHGDKGNKGSDKGHSRFNNSYYGGTTKTKTTSQGSDDKKVNYQNDWTGNRLDTGKLLRVGSYYYLIEIRETKKIWRILQTILMNHQSLYLL